MDVFIAALLMHSTDLYEYYVTLETPIIIMSSVMADCPDSVPPPQYFGKLYASACTTIY